jgi:hypothetical protein
LQEKKQLEPLLAEKPAGLGGFALRHAAALVGVGVGVGLLLAAMGVFRSPVMSASLADVSGKFGTELTVASDYEFLRMRASEELDQHVVLPEKPAAIRFRVLPDEEGAPSYRASLSIDVPSGSEEVAKADGLIPDELHYVTLFVSSEKLVPGTYSLVVEPQEAKSGTAPSFRFGVKR